MPAYLDPRPSWLTNPSVLDAPWQKAVKGLADVFGVSDPMNELTGIATPLVALGGGKNIPLLRRNAQELVERVKEKGLEQRVLGRRPVLRRNRSFEGALDYYPNAPVTKELSDVLDFAMEKYPRLMGHVQNITDTDAINPLAAGSTQQAKEAAKLSYLGLNPGFMKPASPYSGPLLGVDPAETLGHELLHVADRITRPDFNDAYRFSMKLPGGYNASAYEVRARNAGESFAKKFQEWKAKQPQPLAQPEAPAPVKGLMKSLNGWLGR